MPVLAAVVVVSLGIGIGVNTAVFSWIQAVVLQPLPGVAGRRPLSPRRAARRDRIVPGRVVAGVPATCASACRRFPTCSRSAWCRSTLGEAGPHRARSTACSCPATIFRRWACSRRSAASSGRTKSRARAASRSSSISHDFWQTRFGGAPTSLGQTLRVNDRELTIVGVAPERLPGHGPRPQFRSLGAGDARAASARRIARARGPHDARLPA